MIFHFNRAFSGEVSWDLNLATGSTYQEDDLTITHHVIDRPSVTKTYLNRTYIQPQWIFDCINENMILPVDDYLPGATLPAHLSPFVEIKDGDYIPPEKQRLINLKNGIIESAKVSNDTVVEEEPEEKPKVKVDAKIKEVKIKRDSDDDDDSDADEDDDSESEEEEYKSTDDSQGESEEEEVVVKEEEKNKKKKSEEPKV
jgi:pescadillo protein